MPFCVCVYKAVKCALFLVTLIPAVNLNISEWDLSESIFCALKEKNDFNLFV